MTRRGRSGGPTNLLPFSLASPTAVDPAITIIARAGAVVKGRRDRPVNRRQFSRLVDALADLGFGAQQLCGRARDPAPNNASQLVIAAAKPLGFAFCDADRLGAMPPHQQQRGLPDLALVGHHHDRKSRRAGSVPRKPECVLKDNGSAQYLVIYTGEYTASWLRRVQASL